MKTATASEEEAASKAFNAECTERPFPQITGRPQRGARVKEGSGRQGNACYWQNSPVADR
jgi:hypothetical protein